MSRRKFIKDSPVVLSWHGNSGFTPFIWASMSFNKDTGETNEEYVDRQWTAFAAMPVDRRAIFMTAQSAGYAEAWDTSTPQAMLLTGFDMDAQHLGRPSWNTWMDRAKALNDDPDNGISFDVARVLLDLERGAQVNPTAYNQAWWESLYNDATIRAAMTPYNPASGPSLDDPTGTGDATQNATFARTTSNLFTGAVNSSEKTPWLKAWSTFVYKTAIYPKFVDCLERLGQAVPPNTDDWLCQPEGTPSSFALGRGQWYTNSTHTATIDPLRPTFNVVSYGPPAVGVWDASGMRDTNRDVECVSIQSIVYYAANVIGDMYTKGMQIPDCATAWLGNVNLRRGGMLWCASAHLLAACGFDVFWLFNPDTAPDPNGHFVQFADELTRVRPNRDGPRQCSLIDWEQRMADHPDRIIVPGFDISFGELVTARDNGTYEDLFTSLHL